MMDRGHSTLGQLRWAHVWADTVVICHSMLFMNCMRWFKKLTRSAAK